MLSYFPSGNEQNTENTSEKHMDAMIIDNCLSQPNVLKAVLFASEPIFFFTRSNCFENIFSQSSKRIIDAESKDEN